MVVPQVEQATTSDSSSGTPRPAAEGEDCLHTDESMASLDRITIYGPIRGSQDCWKALAFYWVPFAELPGHAGSFRPATHPSVWMETRHALQHKYHQVRPLTRFDAREFMPRQACTQQISAQVIGKEDCLRLIMSLPPISNLSLNWTGKTPPMFWFHGWLSVSGDAWGLLGEYHRAVLARIHNLTVLSVHYRLALFGFLMLKEIVVEEDNAQFDALGVQDQVLAMEWAQDNADNFDFGQTKVVIFGHNAGGWSVCHHVCREQSAGLFSGAIMQSGFCEDIQGTQHS